MTMPKATIETTVARLCNTSIANVIDPHEALEWPDHMDRDQWFTSPEFITLYGTDVWEGMDEAQRKRLSFFEAINFFSLNIHGERMLIEGLSRRLYRRGNEVISRYLHHFLDEENKHMYYFGRFCTQYYGRIYPEKKLVMEREYAEGEEDFLFFARVVVFEEIVDVHNREMAKDERLVFLAREINRIHHFEETRHLSFGRKVTEELFCRYKDEWGPDVLGRIREYLGDYIVATWKEYYNPEMYKDAGLDQAFSLRRKAQSSDHRKAHRTRITAPVQRFFMKVGIFEQEVTV